MNVLADVAAAPLALRSAARESGSSAARTSPSDRSGRSSTARRTSAARARTRRPAASRLGAISRPQPTGTSMNRCSASAPISSARSSSAGSSVTLCLAIVELIWTETPSSRRLRRPRSASACASGQAAERVVGGRDGAVEADRDAREAGVGDLRRDASGRPACRWSRAPCGTRSRRRRRRCRTDRAGTAARRPTARRPAWRPGRSRRSDRTPRRVSAPWARASLRHRAAMPAAQVAGLRRFPEHQSQRRGHRRSSIGRTRMASATARSTASSV